MLVYINYDMGFAWGLHVHGMIMQKELFSGSPTTFLKLIKWNQNQCFLCSIKEQLSLSNQLDDLGNVLIYKGFASRKFLVMYMLVLV